MVHLAVTRQGLQGSRRLVHLAVVPLAACCGLHGHSVMVFEQGLCCFWVDLNLLRQCARV